MKPTLNVIILYLERRGLILDGSKGIVWTFQSKDKLKERVKDGLEV